MNEEISDKRKLIMGNEGFVRGLRSEWIEKLQFS